MKTIMPQDVDDILYAFPATLGNLLPEWNDIPEEFRYGRAEQNKIVSRWFFSGLPSDSEFTPREGVDPKKALRHVSAILRSFEPKHEHKAAACAYLLSLWFSDIKTPTNQTGE